MIFSVRHPNTYLKHGFLMYNMVNNQKKTNRNLKVKTIIDKIIVVEGLDKTGKSTFVNIFENEYYHLNGEKQDKLKKFSFPNNTTPIGNMIRNELLSSNPDQDKVSTPNFLAEMSHFWMVELYNQHCKNAIYQNTTNNINTSTPQIPTTSYIFDRYFISTMAYQAFYNNSFADLDFIKTSLNNNKFIKLPTDVIFLDMPNEVIIQRTLEDAKNGLTDFNDTTDVGILNKRRKAYIDSIKFLKGMHIDFHWFEDVSGLDYNDLAKVLLGKIFK